MVENETLTEEQLEAIEGAELVKETLGTKLVVGSITADRIDVDDLFAQDITATGTITGATLSGGSLTTTSTETPTGRIIDNELTIKDGELYNKVDTKNGAGVLQKTDETWINKSGLLLKSKMLYAHGEPTENVLGISTTDTGASISSIKDLAIGTDNSLYLRGTPITFNGIPLNELLIFEDVVIDNISITSNSFTDSTKSVAKEGYTPLGVVGHGIANATTSGSNGGLVVLSGSKVNGTTLNVRLKNTATNSAAKVKYTGTILYFKNV